MTLNDEKKIKDADVYHVDAEDNVENMDGSVDKNGNVEFETTHFSTYVIVQRGGKNVKVTIQHLDNTTGKEIYSADERTILVGGKINDYTKAQNWEVSKVKVNDVVVTNHEKIEVAQDSTIKVYYTPKRNDNFQGPTSFYDYTVKAGYENGTYYSFNMLGEAAKDNNQKITSGTMDQNYDPYKYNFGVSSGYKENGEKVEDTVNVNGYDSNVRWTEGLLKEVAKDGTVKFNYPEPGFFVDKDAKVNINGTETYLRKVIKDYKVVFDQNGDSYKLTKVIDQNGNQLATAGNDFFPLDGVSSSEEKEKAHNYFFGMRYDVTFKIGDYLGPLDYTFTGDDDLWVVLDGEKIVIDLGGIHQAATKKVNLWKCVEDDDKEKEHTLTILYMERGAGASNCQMEFTLPSARISEVTNVPTTDLVLKKVNKDQKALSGARFTLVNSATQESQVATSVDRTGLVNFTRLRPGTYTLTEDVAPDGYEASHESWIVKVTLSDDNKAVATLYKADGETKIEKESDSLYHIMNYTQEEIIESSMDYNKTAIVSDWDKRTYDITISADSKMTSSATEEKDSVADIMMVFDTSGSMLYDGNESDEKGFSKVGRYKDCKTTLDTSKVYYYTDETTGVRYSVWKYYNAKCPMIYLNEWIYYTGKLWKQVPDNSSNKIYTLDSSLTGLKEAATTFIASTAAASPNSRIGLATFNTSGNLEKGLIEVGSAKDSLIKATDCVYASGGTSPQTGLEIAQNQLKTKRENVPQYVILFTDGDPSTPNDKTASENKATALREAGVKVFTIGLKLNDTTRDWLSGKIASEGCAYTAGSIDELKVIFEKIQQTITQNIDIAGAEIKDVIDPRFVIVKDGESVTNEMIKNAGGSINLGDGGVVSVDESTGNQVVKWTNQTIPNAEKGTWSRTITVRAKDEYIGGNNVPTNVSPDSKITTGYGEAVLPQPKVNVKSDLFVNNKETTIFYGDTVPTTEDIINALFNKNAPQGRVKQLDGTENLVTYTIGADGKPINPDEFELKWYEDENCTTEISKENMAKVKPEPDSKMYYLKVTYENDGLKEVTGDGTLKAHNSQDDKEREYGVYTIHIIAGQIQIIKKLKSPAKENATFIFEVKKGKDKIATATAEVKQSEIEAKVTFELEKNVTATIDEKTPALTKLSRGVYTITEIPDSSYTLKEATVGEKTNCWSKVLGSKEVKFTIGTDTNSKEVLKNGNADTTNGKIGVAEFTNEKSVANVELEKVDKADHSITIKGAKFALYEADENWGKASESSVEGYGGIVSGNNGKIEMKNLPVGNYLLYETEAATGYTCPTEPWRIIVGSGGTVTVQDSNGSAIASKSGSEPAIYQLENAKVYSLPESGGPGTYGFTISGVAILATALLLFINNKRREEEAKRS